MLQFYLSRLTGAVGVFFRMLRTLLFRQINALRARFRQLTNFSRYASHAATETVKNATNTTKPSKREDYISVAGLLIAKGFLLRILLGLVILGAFVWFVAWPFVLSHFLTARFWQEDKRVPGWTGQVIVYADKRKTQPLYAGRLEKGVLQGKGEAYDEKGVLAYRGDFTDGKRSGTGICWSENVLVYEGELADGVYQGRGKLYENGMLKYAGDFEAGNLQGTGKLYENGMRRYEGGFEKNLPEGQGKSYDEKGRLLYEGGFAAGLRSGKGVLYPAEGEKVEAEFRKDEPIGTVLWNREGRLYYEGEWSEEGPNGFGRLYDKAGRALFEGSFAHGTIDGASMVGMKSETLRGQLDEKRTVSTLEGQSGFRLSSPELGLSALCSLQTPEKESVVQTVILTQPAADDGWVRLLPVEGGSIDWGRAAGVTETSVDVGEGGPVPSGSYYGLNTLLPDVVVSVLYPAKDGAAVCIEWSERDATAPAGENDGTDSTAGAAQNAEAAPGAAMEAFINALDSMADTGTVRLNAETSPYYGTEDPAPAIAACASPEEAGQLLDAMADYWLLAHRQDAARMQLSRCESLLALARQDAALGTDRAADIRALEERELLLTAELESCVSARKDLELKTEKLAELPAYDLSIVPVLFDPASLQVEELALVAAAYAQMRTGKDAEGIETEVKSMLLTLQDNWRAVSTQKELCELSLAALRSTAGSFSLGISSREDWYAALDANSAADVAFRSAVVAYEKQVSAMDRMLAGWLNRNCGWHTQELAPVYADLVEQLEAKMQELREARDKAAAEAAEKAAREAAEQAAREVVESLLPGTVENAGEAAAPGDSPAAGEPAEQTTPEATPAQEPAEQMAPEEAPAQEPAEQTAPEESSAQEPAA